jgi:hypothetical protein
MSTGDTTLDFAIAKASLVLLSGLTALGYLIRLAVKITILKSDVHHRS